MLRSKSFHSPSERYPKFRFLFCVPSKRPYVPFGRVAAYVLFNYLYLVILLGLGFWGYLCHILLGLGFGYKYMLIASKKISCCLLLIITQD
jgi:hypothetical protein